MGIKFRSRKFRLKLNFHAALLIKPNLIAERIKNRITVAYTNIKYVSVSEQIARLVKKDAERHKAKM